MRSLVPMISAFLLIPAVALADFGLPSQAQIDQQQKQLTDAASADKAAAEKTAADAKLKADADAKAAAAKAAADKAAADKAAADAKLKADADAKAAADKAAAEKAAGEKTAGDAKQQANGVAAKVAGLVDINSVSVEALQKVPGIDADAAKKIVAGRPWSSKAQLVAKKVLTKANYDKVKNLIVVNKNKKK